MNHEDGSKEPQVGHGNAVPGPEPAVPGPEPAGAEAGGAARAPASSGHAAVPGTSQAKPDLSTRAKGWARKGMFAIIGIAVLVAIYFILAALLPRWWSGFIGRQVDGRMTSGISTGLALGVLCTFIPIVCFALTVVNRGKLRNTLSWLFAIVGVVTAIPNLLTLTVVLGGGNGAHAGERILDVEAPGFRGATLIGALIAVVIAAVVIFYIARYRHRGKQLTAAKGQGYDKKKRKGNKGEGA